MKLFRTVVKREGIESAELVRAESEDVIESLTLPGTLIIGVHPFPEPETFVGADLSLA